MLEFVAETARDGRPRATTACSSTSAPAAGQTVFHLHWHVLGGRIDGDAGSDA